MTRARLVKVAVAICVMTAAFTGSASAATPLPAWNLFSVSAPTNFSPGAEAAAVPSQIATPQYYIVLTNVGGAETTEPVEVVDTLPAGITPSSVAPPFWQANLAAANGPCAVAGQTVTCTIAAPLVPGSAVEIKIPVNVTASPSAPTLENHYSVSGGGAAPVSGSTTTTISSEIAHFGFLPGLNGIFGGAAAETGTNATEAGSHPFTVTMSVGFPTRRKPAKEELLAAGSLRNLLFTLPRGVVANPIAPPARCTEAELVAGELSASGGCPPASEVGLVNVFLSNFNGGGTIGNALYSMVPPPGVPAEFGFNLVGTVVHVMGGLDGDFHLTAKSADILAKLSIGGVTAELWGNPSDPRHDALRVGAGCQRCSIEPYEHPFLTLPTSCTEPLTLGASVASWQEPGNVFDATAPFTDPEGNPLEVSGCSALEFGPKISSKATTNVADSPSGLDFNLHQPQNEAIDGLATAALKDARVTLPAGMTLNASAGNGLASCAESQMGYAPAEGKIRFATTRQTCPNAAKLGSIEVKTPLLKEKLPGAIYLAKPFDNPFGSMLAIYLAIEDEETGIVAKLAGKVEANPVSGQLSAVFKENPQLPLEDIDLHFFNGARSALTTPLTCGVKTTTSTLTPWSTPEGADVHPTDSFQTQVVAGGSGACPTSEANAPNAPAFAAGTEAPQAGAYSPFVLRLTRKDGTQRLTGIDTLLPKGLAAKFAGIPYCSEAQIAQAQSRSNPNQGALEQSNPSCPAASEVGTVTVGAGSGPTPTYVQGHAYLSGPYKGAPLSLAIITPAVAGPFDLGAVVVRTAIYIDPETAQGHAVSDPLPSILQGIPLDIRSVAIKLDRPGGFTLNPTSCDPMSITGAATALTGQSSALTSPFQVGGCNALKFKPNLKISLKGGTKRHRFPALKAVLTYPQGGAYANIASAQVTLPHSAFLEQGHIGTVCTRVQFAANACPKASIYGKARAITPLLDQPLEGPVYLRSSSHELPDVVAALDGQIDVVLAGRVDTGKGGGIRNTFEAVPDAPVSKFILEMQGGKKGLLVNSEDICRKPQRASVSFTGQNGKAFDATPLIKNSCKGKAKKKRGGKKK
jgi:uncharacterized repeat protein (TIGR01451 family)